MSPAKLFKQHFAPFADSEDRDHQATTQKERMAQYFEDPYTYEEQILALGEDAVRPLIKLLADKQHGWCAASLLGDLGINNKAVLQALRKQTRADDSSAAHSARSLCLLGDVEFLFPLVGEKQSRARAISGILTGLTVRASNCPHPIPLDYRPAERLLAMKSAPITRLVTEELQPGSSFIEIKPTDVDEALRGLDSKHVVIRQHAVCVLGDRALGKAVGKVVLPKLAGRLYDKVPNVRRADPALNEPLEGCRQTPSPGNEKAAKARSGRRRPLLGPLRLRLTNESQRRQRAAMQGQ